MSCRSVLKHLYMFVFYISGCLEDKKREQIIFSARLCIYLEQICACSFLGIIFAASVILVDGNMLNNNEV